MTQSNLPTAGAKRPSRGPAASVDDMTDDEEQGDAVIGTALKWSAALLLFAAAIGGGVFAYFSLQKPPVVAVKRDLAPAAARKTVAVEIPAMPFTDITAASGLVFRHESGAAGEKLLPETMGGGCAFLDYDSDGDQDILMVNSCRWPWDSRPASEPPPTMHLFANNGKGDFSDVTAAAGLAVTFYGQGVAVGDYDGDGDVDLYFSAVGPNHLFRNDGGTFRDVTAEAGVAGGDDEWSTGCGFFDYDNDGDLDLFVVNYVKWTREFDLAQNFQLLGGGRAYGRPQNFPGTFPYLFQNDGGKFVEVGAKAGVQVKNPATGVPVAKSLGVTFADLDQDGYLDIVVANDTVQNLLLHNKKDGTFEEIAYAAGVAVDDQGNARGAMGIDAAYFRNNLDVGVAIGNFANEMTALYVAKDNSLQFTDEAIATGLGPQTRLELTFGTLFADVDLDGRLDVISANGHLEEDIQKVQASQTYEQRPHFFWNCGPKNATEFAPVPESKTGADFYKKMVGRGAAVADIDGDGDLDILFASAGQSPRLLRNDQTLGNHWLQLALVGTQSNKSAIGATVEWETDPMSADGRSAPVVQKGRLSVSGTRSYLSQSQLPVTIGLGQATAIRTLTIHWPSGVTQVIGRPAINSRLVVEEPASTVAGR